MAVNTIVEKFTVISYYDGDETPSVRSVGSFLCPVLRKSMKYVLLKSVRYVLRISHPDVHCLCIVHVIVKWLLRHFYRHRLFLLPHRFVDYFRCPHGYRDQGHGVQCVDTFRIFTGDIFDYSCNN